MEKRCQYSLHEGCGELCWSCQCSWTVKVRQYGPCFCRVADLAVDDESDTCDIGLDKIASERDEVNKILFWKEYRFIANSAFIRSVSSFVDFCGRDHTRSECGKEKGCTPKASAEKSIGVNVKEIGGKFDITQRKETASEARK
ncbi:uncharacterized protein LOC111397076 [Olea europaea var. sylvestris]|uniref:uncharacterized protein LOC111397076 n=1 Tax=Olea europaea var. sylvestris TaxID=158386 RepID=UPI000C1D5B53|nr:uncharacterized protein LOC111397076 [Olea europaea var. sylvestris]